MHNFVFALIILGAVALFLVINSVVICNISQRLAEHLEENRLEEAYRLWEAKKEYFSLFVHSHTIETAEREACNMYTAIRCNQPIEAEAARVRMLTAVYEIMDGERPTFFNIFCVDIRVGKVYYNSVY